MQAGSILGDIFLVYVVTQLLTTAYGLTVIGALKPIIEEKLKDRGYQEREKNSLYKFNDKFNAVMLGFIPFYYGYKGLKLVDSKESVNREVDERIVSGDYITHDEQKKIFEQTELEKRDDSLFIPESRINFEKPETYKARKIDNSLYDTYETPNEYVEREMDKDESLKITPFEITSAVPRVVVNEVTSKDVARFISELDTDELRDLRTEIEKMIVRSETENYMRILEKDIA